MKKKTGKNDEMRSEYDFSGGVSGKHFKKLRKGHTTVIHKQDGSTETRENTIDRLGAGCSAIFSG